MKKIIGFGDSWMYGDELLDPELNITSGDVAELDIETFYKNSEYREKHSFLGLLSDRYQAQVSNYAEPANSFDGIEFTFNKWIENYNDTENTLCVFGFTGSDRTSWWYDDDRRLQHSPSVQWHDENPFKGSFKEWITHTNTEEWRKLNTWRVVTNIIAKCQMQGMKFVMFNCLPNSNYFSHPNYFWSSHNMLYELEQLQRSTGQRLLFKGQHPTELGHRKIADYLIDFIDSNEILK